MITAYKEGAVTGLILNVIMSFSPNCYSLGEDNTPFKKSLVLLMTSKIKLCHLLLRYAEFPTQLKFPEFISD